MLERYLEESKAMKKEKDERAPPSWVDVRWGDLQGEVTALQGYRLHLKQRLVEQQGKCLPSKHKDLSLDPQHACAKPGATPIISVLKAGRWGGGERDTGRSMKLPGPSAQRSYELSHLKKTEVRKGMVVGGV